MAIMFLAGVLFVVAFIIGKPHFSALEYAINKAEAKIAVSACPPFKENAGFLKKLVCPSPKAVVAARDALAFDKLYGVKKINLEYSLGGTKKPAYYLIDKDNKKSYAPEILYQIFFWYNYLITWTIAGFLFWKLLKIYSKPVDRVNIKGLGFTQELLYKEAPIQTRPYSKTAEGEIFDIMDYLIPKIHTSAVKNYVDESLRISSKAAHPNFVAAGKRSLTNFIAFLRSVEELRKEAVTHYEKELGETNLFKFIKGNPSYFKKLYKEYGSYVESAVSRGDGFAPSFSDFLKKEKSITDPGLADEKEMLSKFENWRKAKTTDFMYAGLMFLNMAPFKEGIFEKINLFEVNSTLNPIKLVWNHFKYSTDGKYAKYIEEDNYIINSADSRSGEEIKHQQDLLKQRNADLLNQVQKENYMLDEDLIDYIKFVKFYHKPTKQNKKNKPLPITFKNEKTGEERTKADIKKLLLDAPSPILPQRDPNKKKDALTETEKLEDAFESHYYPDDLSEQYGRIIPLPIYIMTAIQKDENGKCQFKDRDGKFTFGSICGNYFLEVFITRTLFGFEKNARDTISKMKSDAEKISDPAERDVLLKLAAETEKQLDPKNQAARAKIINEMLTVYRFEETFLVALLAYGRRILNMPVGILSGKTKRLNPALFYAITALGRTYTFNVSYPISVYYEYEKRMGPQRLKEEMNRQALSVTQEFDSEQSIQMSTANPRSSGVRSKEQKENAVKKEEENLRPIITVNSSSDGRGVNYNIGATNSPLTKITASTYEETDIDMESELFSAY